MKVLHLLLYLVTGVAEGFEAFLLGALHQRRVIKTDMQSLHYLAHKSRARFVGTATDCNDIVPLLVQVTRDVCGRVLRDVNAYLLQHLECHRVHSLCWLSARREDLQTRIEGLEQAVCHLTAAAVACA